MRTFAASLEAAAAAAAGVALAAAYAGPLHFEIWGAAVSVRTLSRPLVAAAFLIAARLWLARRVLAQAWPVAVSRVTCGALVVASAIGWIVYLSPTVGGADSYGYVSAADRLLDGRLIQPEPLATVMPFADGISAATPLGYVPAGRVPQASVPAYPLGLPLVMAVAQVVAGPQGPFWVAPIAAVLLLVMTGLAARAWYDNGEIALLASTLVTVNPLVFTYAIQPMSDVPAAAALMTALAALLRRRSWPMAAGLAAALALMIRPALAPVAGALALIPIIGREPRRLASALTYLAPIIVAAVLQGYSQWYLYGDPFGSGYGSIRGLFSWNTVATNAWIYTHWMAVAMGPVWLAALAVGLATGRQRLPLVVLTLVALGVGLPYLFYRPYDHWETLRFLLPAIVVATIVVAAGVAHAARRAAGARMASPIVATIAVALAWTWMSWVAANQVLTMPTHEARHRLAGELVRQATTSDAVILALQHSGSLRYYTDRQTLNWDRIPTGALEPTVRALQANGHAVYVMIDSDAERVLFDARHGPVLNAGSWLPGGQRRNLQLFEAARTGPPASR